MDAIDELLAKIKLGGKQSHLNMALYPFLMPDTGDPDYLTLEEALAEGVVEITEVSEGGSVPELMLINKSADKVLVVDGEELVGAKQNRIVNASFLIAGHAKVVIPVSCVEQGRWTYLSRKFASGEKIMPASLKREHQARVAFSLAKGAGYRSDQGMIWNELAMKSERMATPSATGAMADLFEGQKDRLGEYLKAFRLVECQVGAVFAVNGEVVGLECFGHQHTFQKFFPKLIQSYALDALDWLTENREYKPSAEAASIFLEQARKAPREAYPSLGLGENVRMGQPVSGAALLHDGRVLHLSVFKQPVQGTEKKIPFQRYSQRNRRR